MLAAFHTTTGDVDVLRYGKVDDPPPPEPGEILIRVAATSLDRVDLYWREGSHGMAIRQQPHIGGRDIAGVVEAIGAEVTGLAPGDRVVASGSRAHATLAIASAALTLRLPPGISLEEAAAIPTAGRSAHQALVERVRVQPGERVLVTAAGSGVGSFGIQIAHGVGADVLAAATVRPGATADKLAAARAAGARVAFDSARPDLADAVLAATDGRGVDVVLDHVGTPLWEQVFRCLAPWGRYVTTGVTGGHRVPLHLGQVFVKGITVTGVGRPTDAQIRATLTDLLAMVADGRVRPPVAAVLPLARIADAHRLLDSNDLFGKVVLVP